jgi:lipid-A-disaccharide synthase-like uncharacterized protein
MNSWFNSPAVWYAVGFAGQLLFSSRFFVQWLVSERAKRVIIPPSFWFLSMGGGVALLAYAIHRQDPVFALGQAAGLIVYARNMHLGRHGKNAAT